MRVPETLNASSITGDNSNSGLISSGQKGMHPGLEKIVQRHLDNRWLQPLHRPSVDSYQRLKNESSFTVGQAFILDSGCGTGRSTQQLARRYPEHLVIGVDRSQARLAKSGMEKGLLQRGNCILLRADLSTIWRLLLRDGFVPYKHFLFYPNPWPKSAHLKRRWHGHPVFPVLLALGGELEMRCNWEIYALEFAWSAGFATGEAIAPRRHLSQSSESPFEEKYMRRSHRLFSVIVSRQVTRSFRHSV